ncbi:MAG TPA: hypothetical protein VGM54_02115 [Chthoniobacter sp.]|jgi:hypothetical protein
MPDLDSALRQRAHELALIKAREDAARQESAVTQLSHEAGRLEKLAAYDEVKWFFQTYVRPLVEAELSAALDLARSAAERDNSAHRYGLGRMLLELLPAKAAAARSAAAAAAQKCAK